MRKILLSIALSILSLLFISCSKQVIKNTNLTAAALVGKPSTEYHKDFSFNASRYNTFSVIPNSTINDSSMLSGIPERHMLFLLRNRFEKLGYDFILPNMSPDFVVTVDASAPYHETEVPPKMVAVPHWVPGTQITSYTQNRGNFDLNTFGDIFGTAWGILDFYSSTSGSYSGTSTTTTHVPGYLTTKTHIKPGYIIGFYYPAIGVSIFDAKEFYNVWVGLGVGCAKHKDIRINGQYVLKTVLDEFPMCEQADTSIIGTGWIGIEVEIFTNNGNDYYPTVTKVYRNFPAEKAGVKHGDMITSIDGVSMRNKTLFDALHALAGNERIPVKFSLARLDENIAVDVVRLKRKWSQTIETIHVR